MFDVCSGKYKDSAQVLTEIDTHAFEADPKELELMRKSFATMNPYLAYQLLAFSSKETKDKDGKTVLQLGDRLPMDELAKCPDDAARAQAVRGVMSELIKQQEASQKMKLNDLIAPLIVTTSNAQDSAALFSGIDAGVILKQWEKAAAAEGEAAEMEDDGRDGP